MKKHSEKTSLLGGEVFFSWCTPDIHFFQQLLDYQAGHLSGWGLPIGQFNWKLSKSQAWQVFRENHGRVLPSRHQCRRIPSLWSWDMDSFPRGYLSFKNLCLHINEIYHDLSIPSNSSCFYLHQLMAMCFFWTSMGRAWNHLTVTEGLPLLGPLDQAGHELLQVNVVAEVCKNDVKKNSYKQ